MASILFICLSSENRVRVFEMVYCDLRFYILYTGLNIVTNTYLFNYVQGSKGRK